MNVSSAKSAPIDALLRRQWMAFGHDEDKGFLPKHFDLDSRIGDRKRNKGQIQLSIDHLPHQGCLKILPDIDLKIWKALSTAGDQRGKHERCESRDGTDRDLPFQGWVIRKFLGSVLHLKQDAAGSFKKHSPCLREDGLASQSMEKLMAEFLFKLYYLLTERRLGNI